MISRECDADYMRDYIETKNAIRENGKVIRLMLNNLYRSYGNRASITMDSINLPSDDNSRA